MPRHSLAIRLAAASVLVLAGVTFAQKSPPPTTEQALAPADPQMTKVLDALKSMDPKPIASLSPAEARKQPTAAMAAMKVMKDEGKPVKPEAVGDVDGKTFAVDDGHGGTRDVKVRVYTPEGNGPFPVIVYAHGGGWVIATLDTYDASCRSLTRLTNAIVVSVDYRQAPENKFPAANEDVYAVLQYVAKHAADFKGDPAHVAIAGESAGGNLAAAACLMAKDRGGFMPAAQLLVYPIVGHDFSTPSYLANAETIPLNSGAMQWFFHQYLSTPDDVKNKYVVLTNATKQDLSGLPPATVITAQIDPLHDDGQTYAKMLKDAGVDVAYQDFAGVTHEFFGMAAVVDKAMEAQKFAADRLKLALGKR